MREFFSVSLLVIVCAVLYSVLSEETTPVAYKNEFFKNISDLICKPPISDDKVMQIKNNCPCEHEKMPTDPWINCTGMPSLTERQRFEVFCNVTVANCASDIYSNYKPPAGVIPKSAEELKNFQANYTACLQKQLTP